MLGVNTAFEYSNTVLRVVGVEHESLVGAVSASFDLQSGTQEKAAARSCAAYT